MHSQKKGNVQKYGCRLRKSKQQGKALPNITGNRRHQKVHHVFHLDCEVADLEKWEEFISMFDECGFEVYELMGWEEVELSVLRFRELSERLQQQPYSVNEFLDSREVSNCEDRQAVIDS